MKDYLNIGEMSDLFGLNVQTLRYYEKIGIFVPSFRDDNGFRKYKFDKIYELASIRYMRKMGYSIEEIQKFLALRHPDESIALLYQHSKELRARLSELERIDGAIMRKLAFISEKRKNLDTDSLTVRHFPKRYYIPIGTEDQLYLEDSFYFYPTIAFYEGTVKYFGAYIDQDIASDTDGGDGLSSSAPALSPKAPVPKVDVIPEGDFLVGYHCGPYEKCPAKFRAMRYTYPDLHYTGNVINFNIIDQFVERDPENYITEVQIPLFPDAGNA